MPELSIVPFRNQIIACKLQPPPQGWTASHDASHLVQYLEAYAALVRSAAVKFLDWQLGDYHRQAGSPRMVCMLACCLWTEAYIAFLSCLWLNTVGRLQR